ncbi:osmotically inducible protein C [Domibacillus aminovorans]|uniref:Osmotically inducible protein C n=1 Tax=Domibacillus aminovorans TaxID=29332 RepID=A0A177KIU0_9BACI|nr:OsmC family protein [Domibacillus aminovorans]OAH53047.1 osmotically inducible protein C [Domibacillus aminovorans]
MEFKMKESGFTAEFPYGKLDISGDEEQGFRPYQLLVSSVAVCSGGVLRKIFAKQRIEIEDITIQTDVKRNPDKADRVEKISVHFIIKGTGLKEDKVKKALALTRRNCSMVQSVIPAIEVEETFEIK